LGSETITSMLDRHFHLFPPPQLYAEPVSEHDWVSKFYFGISRNTEGHFPTEGKVKHIVGGESLMFCFGGQPAPV